MKIKQVLLFIVMCNSLHLFSQKDSISTYLDRRYEITTKKENAKYIKTWVKKDSLWNVTIYFRDGKIFTKGFSKKLGKRTEYVGKHLTFHRNGKLAKKVYYDNNHQMHGKIVTLFDNGKRNYTGVYNADAPQGLWKYYYYNGKLAGKFYYDVNGDIEKYLLFNENGEELKEEDYIKRIKPVFKKGEEEFNSVINYMISNLSYTINTTIYVNFIIDIDGSIRDVWIVNNIPKKLKKEIIEFFESIKGWSPLIDMNRKIPSKYGIALNIKTRLIGE